MISRDTIISLCDHSGLMAEPWARGGYDVVLVDPLHGETTRRVRCGCGHEFDGGDVGRYGCPNCGGQGGCNAVTITRMAATVEEFAEAPGAAALLQRAALVASFPVCTDLAVSGTGHWQKKRAADPHFQAKARKLVDECRMCGILSGAPWFVENPVGALSSMWRKPDRIFHPWEYGGYLPEDDEHPIAPDYKAPRDAEKKRTCLWFGGGFVMPPTRPVPVLEDQEDGQGGSKSHNKLGGRSKKTKAIRSMTPRGFAEAVYLANAPHLRGGGA